MFVAFKKGTAAENTDSNFQDQEVENSDLDLVLRETESKSKELFSEEVLCGHLDGIDDEGRLLFKAEGSRESVPVMIGMNLFDDELVKAARLERRSLILRTGGKKKRLVLIGFLKERVRSEVRDAESEELKTKIDGNSLLLSAKKQIELVCGKSRIVLHRDGRVELNGSYLLSRSSGPIKIKGASVEIN